jgi:hypothetical protein
MSAFNPFDDQLGPRYQLGAGIRTELGTLTPPGGEVVAYVRSTGPQDGDDEDIVRLMVLTLDDALAKCRSGMGDTVLVLPGHAENISVADQMSSLVAGTRILGLGTGSIRPTFTWTVAAASFLLDVADVTLSNCILQMAAAGNAGVTVAAPMTVSAANCEISDCDINFGDDANDIVGQAINTTAAADGLAILNNRCIGATAAECETFLNLVGVDDLKLIGNYIYGASSAVAVGLVRCETTTCLRALILDNFIANNKAASTDALTLLAGFTGFVDGNNLHVLDGSTLVITTDGDIIYGNDNYLTNTVGERGIQLGTVAA